jgi:hypothetical protein
MDGPWEGVCVLRVEASSAEGCESTASEEDVDSRSPAGTGSVTSHQSQATTLRGSPC